MHPRGGEPRMAVGGLSDDARIELFHVGENRLPRKFGLAKVGRLTDVDVLVEHETQLVRERLWTLLEQEHTALTHGDRAVLIDDLVEKLDLARARPTLSRAARESSAAHMQPIAWSDRQLPADLFHARLIEDGGPNDERLAIHFEQQRRRVPSRSDEAASCST